MILLPASAEPAANAGTGPEGHKRSSSVDSGASSDATMVASDINWIDVADTGAVDGRHKLVAIEEALTSPPEPLHQRAASIADPAIHDAKRGRVSTDTASGAPALATHTTTAGSLMAAAPITVSISTATVFAVADPNADTLNEPNEAPDAGYHEGAPAHSAPRATARDVAAVTAPASSAEPEAVIALSTPAPASGAIVNHHDLVPASASTTTGAACALGAAACESATIDANPASRGDAGCPETPVVSRRSHTVVVRPFSIGRTSTPAPAPQAGGSKSAVIVANTASRRGAHCPSTPVVSRVPVRRSHVIAGAAVPAVPAVGSNGQVSALRIGLRCSASAAAPTHAPAPTPAVLPITATALSPFELVGSRMRRIPSQISRARTGALRAVSRVIQRGMGAIRNALVALFNSDMESTKRQRSTLDEAAHWDEGAPVDAVLLGLRKRQRRRFL